ncbi:LTA synthase family protein [Paenibacillus aceti]|uniref:Sulfatase N-terminal domain-containing protein n=1 Tax=Paenibacillus aceti TaxID=1820010 RepID=A0ABQ1VTD9_9BACL|nr:LTA synthase family protein [Paenibacillus aceti]GGF97839.1 hypothetical protein GCM10010913_19480 [Paenibacillus aceti]
MGNDRTVNRWKFVVTFLLILLKVGLMRFFFYEGIRWGGLPAEALSMLALLCLVDLLFPIKRKGIVYTSFNIIISLILFAATLYFAHFGTIPTYAVLSELNQVPQIRGSVNALLRPEQFLYFVDIVVLWLVLLVRKIVSSRRSRRLSFSMDRRDSGGRSRGWMIGVSVVLVLCVGASALYVRSGKGIDNELVRGEKIGLLNYQVDAALRNQEEERMIREGNLQEKVDEIHALQNTYPYRDRDTTASGTPDYFGAAKGKNLIVIQMESFQNFPIGLKIGDQEVTPVLNSLIQDGIYFPYVYQQIGQGNTSDAEFMSNTSIYPTAAVAMSTGYGNRELPSLPRLLQQHGYVANTFHINDVTFWDRNKLYPALHFDKYYDKPAYNNDHFNDFGASDEEMYRVGVDKLQAIHNEGKPFYAQFVTTSSHSPFIVPKDKLHIQLPEDIDGTNLGNYIAAINYTDYAIGALIDQLKETGMWDDTMLVIYGDHFGVQPNDTSASEIEQKLGIAYDNRVSRFNIPLIMHIPGQQLGIRSERAGGQVDIMPTAVNLLGISLQDEGFTALGQDLLNIDRNVIGMRYYLPTGSFFNDEIMFVPGQSFEEGSAVSIKTLEPVVDFSKYRNDYDYIMKLMGLSDQYVKLLPKRG